jgi:hypothetical protein
MQRNFAELEAADFEKAVHVVLWEIVVLQSNSRSGREANGGTCPGSRFCAHVEQLGAWDPRGCPVNCSKPPLMMRGLAELRRQCQQEQHVPAMGQPSDPNQKDSILVLWTMSFHYAASCALSSCIQGKRGFDLITRSRPWGHFTLKAHYSSLPPFPYRYRTLKAYSYSLTSPQQQYKSKRCGLSFRRMIGLLMPIYFVLSEARPSLARAEGQMMLVLSLAILLNTFLSLMVLCFELHLVKSFDQHNFRRHRGKYFNSPIRESLNPSHRELSHQKRGMSHS